MAIINGNGMNNVLSGTAADDVINGGGGNDSLSGLGGNDRLNGGVGIDMMMGGVGNDTYFVDNVSDRATEAANAGLDRIESIVTFMLGANLENLALRGTAAINGTGNGIANLLIGNSAANMLDGRGGADTMNGWQGDDVYVVDNVADRAFENDATNGGGIDRVRSTATHTLGTDIENLLLAGTAAINGTGNGLANLIIGNHAANRIDGMGGADTMNGWRGNDVYIVDNVGDQANENLTTGGGLDLVQSSVTHILGGNIENLTLVGTAGTSGSGNALANRIVGNLAANGINGAEGNDTLIGGGGADSINGGDGNDTVFGGAGNDLLRGGVGVDGFVFDTALNPNVNVDDLLDFSAANDVINLDRTIFTAILVDGTLAAGAFVQGTAAGDANDRILYDSASGNIFYDSDGNGAAAAVLFAQVNFGTVLTNADFVAVA